MSAEAARESLRQGNIDEALAGLTADVKAHPADPKLRIFLFQLLCIKGEWKRAVTQLAVCGELDAGALAMVQAYREAIRCEVYRTEVFAGKRSPLFLGEPPQWTGLLLEALKHVAENKFSQAASLRDQAFEQAEPIGGTVDGQPFTWLADADTRLGPMIEAIVNGRYYWIPQTHIARIDIEAPSDLRDYVWMPAHFTWQNGGDAPALIPTRYPGTESAGDPAVVLSRQTLWTEQDGHAFGVGQRLYATDSADYAIMDVRQIVFGPAKDDENA